MCYLLSWHISKISWYRDKSAFLEKAAGNPNHILSCSLPLCSQIPFWSDEDTRNLNTLWRNKCCNNLKGGRKPTKHAELLFSNLLGLFYFFWSCCIGFLFPSFPFSACWRTKWALLKREAYVLRSILWIEVDLYFCLDFVPTLSQVNFIEKIQLHFSV